MDIKELRTKLNLTPAELAVKLGVHIRTIKRWESGETKPSKLALTLIDIIREENND